MSTNDNDAQREHRRLLNVAIGTVIAIALGLAALLAAGRYTSQEKHVREPEKSAQEEEEWQRAEKARRYRYTTPAPVGPNCSKGCRCGNSCISCSKTCRK